MEILKMKIFTVLVLFALYVAITSEVVELVTPVEQLQKMDEQSLITSTPIGYFKRFITQPWERKNLRALITAPQNIQWQMRRFITQPRERKLREFVTQPRQRAPLG